MSYPYDGNDSGSTSGGQEAGQIGEVAGACPPETIWYRIYPEYEFNEVFGTVPANVDT